MPRLPIKEVTFKEALILAVVKGAGYAWSIENGHLNIKAFEEWTSQLDYLDMAGETVVEIGDRHSSRNMAAYHKWHYFC